MTTEITTDKSHSAAEEGDKVVYKVCMAALTGLIYYDFGGTPWICVVVDFVVVTFAGREIEVVAAHC
jgi:hypothetical protein